MFDFKSYVIPLLNALHDGETQTSQDRTLLEELRLALQKQHIKETQEILFNAAHEYDRDGLTY